MIKKDTLNKILWSTIEDYVGIWEINWELNSIFSNNSQSQNRGITQKVLKYFFNESLIKFYHSKWGIPNSHFEEINVEDIDGFLKTEKFWNPPSIGKNYLCIGSTEKGENFYKIGKLEDLN